MYQPENKKVSISVIFVYFVRPLAGLPPRPARAARPDLAREQAPWTRALTRYSRRRAAGVNSRNRLLRSLCTRKEAL